MAAVSGNDSDPKGMEIRILHRYCRLVDQLMEDGEFRHLKGLLYFTDGDGIYPDVEPVYETAFVFINQKLKKGKTPDWAYDLNLGLETESV